MDKDVETEEMELLSANKDRAFLMDYNGEQTGGIIVTDKVDEESGITKGELPTEGSEETVTENRQDSKCQVSSVVEDALEKTINEVAETSLESAAVEGEDLSDIKPGERSNYDWDAPIVKDIVRRVKNHRLSHAKAAEQLSLLMDAKVTTIGVRLQVVKMANDEALAKQDQQSMSGKRDSSSNAHKNTSVGESKLPISYRTRSKTDMNSKENSAKSSSKDGRQNINNVNSVANNGTLDSIPNLSSVAGSETQRDASNSQMYVPVVISQSTSPVPVQKTAPPIIRLLDNEGKLTHIAVAENGSYKLYRVNEGNVNMESLQAVTAGTSSASNEVSMNNPVIMDNQTTGTNQATVNSASDCSANYFIESVPAQQTLGALVGIPKFVNPQRYGGNSVYMRTYGPCAVSGNIQFGNLIRSRSEVREEVKRLIRCVKSHHISSDEAIRQLFEYAALKLPGFNPLGLKISSADSGQNYSSSVDFETSVHGDDGDNTNEAYTRLVDEQGNMNIAIAEENGYRVYRLNKTAQNMEVYKCVDCDSLHKTKRDPIATVRITDGMLCGDIHPTHHPRCPLQTLSVKECEQDLVINEKESLLIHDVATDVEESRKKCAARSTGNVKRSTKQSTRKNQEVNKTLSRKRTNNIPERSFGMTLRKRNSRTLISPGIYDSEVMS